MHIVIAACRLKPGVTEEAMIAASDAFDQQFVRKQDGVIRRTLVRDGRGGYADIVLFKDEDTIARVMEAEKSSEVCAALFALLDGEGEPKLYEIIKTYE